MSMTNDTTPPEPESAQTKKTRLEIAREKAAQATALLEKLEAQARKRAAKNGRKLDERRKILIGAGVLNDVKKGRMKYEDMQRWLDPYLIRAAERALFDLPPLTPTPAPAEAQSTGSAASQEQPPAIPASIGENAPQAQSGV